MKVLFIGGTGRLSKDVAALAIDKGHEVFLITRGSSGRKKFVSSEYNMLFGDIRNVDEAKRLISDYSFDVVVDFLTYNIEQLKKTLNIIHDKYKQYIFISTATVYKKKSENEIISEDSTEIGNDKWQYAYDKYLCEEYLKKYFAGLEQTYTIVRPYVTYGNTRVPYPIVPGDVTKEWSLIDRILNGRPIPVFDKGQTITTLTHTRDFAKGVVGLFGNECSYGEAFHITSDETTTWGQVLECLEKKLNKKIIHAEMSQEQIYREIPMYQGILQGDKGTTMRFNNNKIHNVVKEFSCKISLEEGIADMIDFYNANPDIKLIDYYWDGCIDRLCNKVLNLHFVKYEFPNAKEKIRYYMGRYKLIGDIYKIINKIRG